MKAEKSDVGNISKRGNDGQGTAQEEAGRSRIKNRWKEVGRKGCPGSSGWTSPKVFAMTSKSHHFLKADQVLDDSYTVSCHFAATYILR